MLKLFECLTAVVPFHVMVVPSLGTIYKAIGLHSEDHVLFSKRMSAVSATRGGSQLGTYLGTHLATSVLPAGMSVSPGLSQPRGRHSAVLTRMTALSAVGCLQLPAPRRAGRHRFVSRCDGGYRGRKSMIRCYQGTIRALHSMDRPPDLGSHQPFVSHVRVIYREASREPRAWLSFAPAMFPLFFSCPVPVLGERSSRAPRGEFQIDDGGGAGEVSQPGGVGRGRLATAFNRTHDHAFEQLACVPYDTTADLCSYLKY